MELVPDTLAEKRPVTSSKWAGRIGSIDRRFLAIVIINSHKIKADNTSADHVLVNNM